MDYEEIYGRLTSVINALNAIETHGRNNLLNLGGSINILEEIARSIKEAEKTDKGEDK